MSKLRKKREDRRRRRARRKVKYAEILAVVRHYVSLLLDEWAVEHEVTTTPTQILFVWDSRKTFALLQRTSLSLWRALQWHAHTRGVSLIAHPSAYSWRLVCDSAHKQVGEEPSPRVMQVYNALTLLRTSK